MKKNVLVTGATGGIGEAICNKLKKKLQFDSGIKK